MNSADGDLQSMGGLIAAVAVAALLTMCTKRQLKVSLSDSACVTTSNLASTTPPPHLTRLHCSATSLDRSATALRTPSSSSQTPQPRLGGSSLWAWQRLGQGLPQAKCSATGTARGIDLGVNRLALQFLERCSVVSGDWCAVTAP